MESESWRADAARIQMLEQIQKRCGQAERIWVMDRGIPTEAVLEELLSATLSGRGPVDG